MSAAFRAKKKRKKSCPHCMSEADKHSSLRQVRTAKKKSKIAVQEQGIGKE